jgi:hypothetical protein
MSLPWAQERLVRSILPDHAEATELSEPEVLRTLTRSITALPPGVDLGTQEPLASLLAFLALTTTHARVQQLLADLELEDVDEALLSSDDTRTNVLESVLRRTPHTSGLWNRRRYVNAYVNARDGGPLAAREWMPVSFLRDVFPGFFDRLAQERDLDLDTLLELVSSWEGSLEDLVNTARDLGPDAR